MAEQEQVMEHKMKTPEVSPQKIEENEAEDVKFVKANGETLTNMQAIESCRHEQNRDIIDNLRLGSYDRFGNYIIVPAIREELLTIPKIVYVKQVQKDKTIFDMKSMIPLFGDIFFKLVSSKEEVTLYLVETVRREAGDYVEVYEEVLDNFSMTEDDYVPLSVIFRNYNIYDEDDGDYGKKIFSAFDFMNILTRKIYLSLLSRELMEIAEFDDKQAFEEMIAILKDSGEYGERVLEVFENRVKDRPEIYDLATSKEYNKAVLEILLSAVDIATTQADKENFETREVYFKLLGVRNKNIDKYIEQANEKIDEQYVSNIVTRATKHFLQDDEEKQDEVLLDFMDKISPTKKRTEKRKLDAPILKQGLEERKEAERIAAAAVAATSTKEEAIKQILTAKKDEKKKSATPANKKLKPAKKAAKKSAKKGGKGKAKAKGKAKPKAKVKAKKAVKKPQDAKKAAAKTGKKLKPAKKAAKKSDSKKKGKDKKKKKDYGVTFSRSFLEKYRSISSLSGATVATPTVTPTLPQQSIVETIKTEQAERPQRQNVRKQQAEPNMTENTPEFGFASVKPEIKKEVVSRDNILGAFNKSKNAAMANIMTETTPNPQAETEVKMEAETAVKTETQVGGKIEDVAMSKNNIEDMFSDFFSEQTAASPAEFATPKPDSYESVKEQIIKAQLKKKQQSSTTFAKTETIMTQGEASAKEAPQPETTPKQSQDEQLFH